MIWVKSPNFLGGRLHPHGGELTAFNPENQIFTWGFIHGRLLVLIPFTSIAVSSTIAPRIEIYTALACTDIYGESFQRLDILDFVQQSNDPAAVHQSGSLDVFDAFMIDKSLRFNDADPPPTRKQRCASDPVVQAAVAKLSTGAYNLSFLLCTSTWTRFLSPGIILLKQCLSLHYVG